ncbi:MAG: DinB family protein [Vicinamibacteria bacterium]|nr:DinB family protein [Vicinamibacteria bacterium]
MTPEQARLMKEELHGVDKEIRSITEGLDATGLRKRPGPSSWSVAENLEHLILTAEVMMPLIDDAVAKLERAGGKASRPSGLGFMGWMLLKALEPPPRMKSRTSKPFEPQATGDPLTLADRLRATNVKLGALIDRADGLATGTVKIASPFDARVKYNAYAALRITLVHARRHLWQARQARPAA